MTTRSRGHQPGRLSRRAVVGGMAGLVATRCVRAPAGRAELTVGAGQTLAAVEHVYVVLDEASWSAVRSAGRLEQLGATDAGLPSFRPPTPTTHVVYLRGRQTYVELMGPQNAFGVPVGFAGLGLIVNDARALESVARGAASTLKVERLRKQVTWDVPAPRPWQQTIWFPSLAEHAVSAWVSAYEPDFLPWLAPGKTGTRAADFLSVRHDPQRPFIDLSSVEIGASASTRSALAAVLEGVGLTRTGDFSWSDGSTRIELSAEGAGARLGLRLRRPVAPWKEQRCALEQQGPDAILSF